MDANTQKIARKFNLSYADAETLVKAGFDTPTKIKNADSKALPDGFAAKLTRWHGQAPE